MARVKGYHQRRAWAAWHAGYPGLVENPKFEDLMPRPPLSAEEVAEANARNTRLWNDLLESMAADAN